MASSNRICNYGSGTLEIYEGRDMWCDDNLRMRPKRIVFWERFGFEDIEGSSGDMASFQQF